MNRIMRALAFSGLIATAAPGGTLAAGGPSLAKAVKDWGLLGTWAIDCKAPAGRRNVFSTYVVRHGRAFLERDFGRYGRDSGEIVAIPMIAGDVLEFTVEFRTPDESRTIALQHDTPTAIRTIWNRDNDGHYSVRTGRRLRDGAMAQRQSKCR